MVPNDARGDALSGRDEHELFYVLVLDMVISLQYEKKIHKF